MYKKDEGDNVCGRLSERERGRERERQREREREGERGGKKWGQRVNSLQGLSISCQLLLRALCYMMLSDSAQLVSPVNYEPAPFSYLSLLAASEMSLNNFV